MDFDLGIVCGFCESFSPVGQASCSDCGRSLSLVSVVPGGANVAPSGAVTSANPSPNSIDVVPAPVGAAESTASAPTGAAELSEEERMEQARNYVCRECSSAVPSGHKFCGTCGAAVPIEVVELQTNFFGSMQTPGKARLILIRGDSEVDGLSYMLQGTQHVAGREDGQILFPEDSWLSARHANFVYEADGQLVVHDEGSLNGIYLRVRDQAAIAPGDTFLCGEQLFRLDAAPAETGAPGEDQTYFYSSPRKEIHFAVTQLLVGDQLGLVYSATGNRAQIGREECEMNFPLDVFMSGRHAHVERSQDGKFSLIDDGSKNGTYVRVADSAPLSHGDYIFLGKQLLRVEMTA